MSILQGYLINDPEVLADLGVPPQGKAT